MKMKLAGTDGVRRGGHGPPAFFRQGVRLIGISALSERCFFAACLPNKISAAEHPALSCSI